jgi:sugar phosphate isomerase/epimerase
MAAAKPNSVFGGVQIGAITYSYRSLPGYNNAQEVLKYCLDSGISGIEFMAGAAENYAGMPAQAGRGGGGQGGAAGAARAGAAGAASGGAPGAAGAAGAQGRAQGGGGGRAPMTPEQQEAQRKGAEAVKTWRLSVSMNKYKALRKMYNDAGVKIVAFKLPPNMNMSDEEYAYIWNVAETLGASHVTTELPTDDKLLQRVADYAAKRKLQIAFHTHGQGGSSGFDRALGASKYTALNLDVGHYYGVNGESPVPVMEKYHDRISSLHIKDCKGPNDRGVLVPWGEGGTPLTQVLQSMKKNRYKFPAFIEYEYQTPAGSDVVTEVKKCVEYCRKVLAS